MRYFAMWICPDCDGHEFILVTVDVLPYEVIALCSGCGRNAGFVTESQVDDVSVKEVKA